MLNELDSENLQKSTQTSNLLVQDLQALARSSNPQITKTAEEILQIAVELEKRLLQLEIDGRE